jgi:hypothetical protein
MRRDDRPGDKLSSQSTNIPTSFVLAIKKSPKACTTAVI